MPLDPQIGPSASAAPDGEEELSVLYPLNVFLRNLRRIVLTGLVAAILICLLSLLGGRAYRSGLIFVPQSSEASISGISTLAAQFGFALPGAETTESPEFYEALVRSRPILEDLVRRNYEAADGGTLVDVYEVDADTEAEAVDEATRELRTNIGTDADPVTGMVTVTVKAETPELAAEIASNVLTAVQDFNLTVRRSQAAAERNFAEERLVESRGELRATEDSLQAFLQANRDYGSAPALVFQADRLERNVALRQDVVNSLTQAYEQARLAEVRNTPVITIVQPPFVPVEPDDRNIPIKFVLAFVVGAAAATIWAFVREALEQARSVDAAGGAEFDRLTAGARRAFARLAFWRRRPA